MATITTPDLPQDLVEQALKLPPASREKLGQLLLDSLLPKAHSPEAMRNLIRSRIEQVVNGKAELHDADEVLEELDREFGREDEP